MQHKCDKHQPGNASCYRVHGCRCEDCAREASRARKRSRCGLTDYMDAADTSAILREWLDAGWGPDAVGSHVGISGSHVLYIAKRARSVRRDIARKVGSLKGVTFTPSGTVSAVPSMRRIDGLMLLGWTCEDIASSAGVRLTRIQHLRYRIRVRSETHAAIAAATRLLGVKRGPSEIGATRAAAAGLVPLLAWDEGRGRYGIDNPSAAPRAWRAGSS